MPSIAGTASWSCPLAAGGDLDGARFLLFPRASGERCGIGRRSRAEQRIVGRLYPRGQHQRVEIDVPAVAWRFALDVVDCQGSDIDMLPIARPWNGRVVGRVAGLADPDDQPPLDRCLSDARDPPPCSAGEARSTRC